MSTIANRQIKEKQLLLEQLKKTPIVQIACEKIGVARATYYRWRKDDPEFSSQADSSLREGNMLINDMAESQLLSAIRDKNLTAIIFWLKNHHSAYATKVEVTTNTRIIDEKLNPEQQELLKKALGMISLLPDNEVIVESSSNERSGKNH